jgi:predicted component of viral defense system (DUF524 family)
VKDLLRTARLDVTGGPGTIDTESKPPRLYAEESYLVRLRRGTFPPNLAATTTTLPGGEVRLLRFGNFVGLADVDGVTVRVDSRRITVPDFERMLTELVEDVQNTPSRVQPPTGATFDRPFAQGDDVQLLEYVVIRDAVAGKGPHDLESALTRILARPHERLTDERIERPIWAADRINGRTLVELVARPIERISVPPDSPFANLAITRRLDGSLPARVEVVRSVPTTDTLENRFVATVLDRCLALVRSIAARAARDSSPAMKPLHAEAIGVADTLERWRSHRVLEGLQPLRRLPTTSTVLRGRPGYRDVLRFYADLLGRTRLFPPTAADQIVALRNVAQLYEWWCFFRVVAAASEALDTPAELDPRSADWEGAKMGYGLTADFGNGIRIQFNRTFSKSAGPYHSYSLMLRPDILVETPSGRHLFDAKFAFELTGAWVAADDDDGQAGGGVARAWRSHIHKMHSYRDALENVRSVRVLYPGESAEWHEVSESLPLDGVGALPLRVGNAGDAEALCSLLKKLFLAEASEEAA